MQTRIPEIMGCNGFRSPDTMTCSRVSIRKMTRFLPDLWVTRWLVGYDRRKTVHPHARVDTPVDTRPHLANLDSPRISEECVTSN
jgi:hypothetical protein